MMRAEHRSVDTHSNTPAPSLNVMLGAWLLVSAFLWPHTAISRFSTGICGLLVTTHALAAMRIPPMRWLNAAVGTVVVLGAALLPHVSTGTVFNNIIVGLAIVLVAVGEGPRGPRR